MNDPNDNDSTEADALNSETNMQDKNTGSPETESVPAEDPSVAASGEASGHEAEMTKLRTERDHFEQQLQRAMADTQNIRRRQRQEMDDNRRRVLEGITQELLPVLDSFGLALEAYDTAACDGQSESATSGLVEGVRMVQTLLNGALERHGLQEIPAIGLAFDPNRHEALSVEPNEDVAENEVVRVVQTGYQLGEHVVRHSKVIVAGPAKPQ